MHLPAAQTVTELVAAYRRIGEHSMRGLGFYNDRLDVEAVGFRPWEGHQVGVLVTPWFMNLVLLPGPADDWTELAKQEFTEWKFPAERYRFHPADLEGIGVHLTLPLFSEATVFPDQATARAVATETLRQLFRFAADDTASPTREEAVGEMLETPVSRRGLLTFVAKAGGGEQQSDA